MRIAVVIANCYAYHSHLIFCPTVDYGIADCPVFNSQVEDFFYMFQSSARLKQCTVVWNDEERRIYKKIYRKEEFVTKSNKYPGIYWTQHETTRKPIVVSTMTRPKFE